MDQQPGLSDQMTHSQEVEARSTQLAEGLKLTEVEEKLVYDIGPEMFFSAQEGALLALLELLDNLDGDGDGVVGVGEFHDKIGRLSAGYSDLSILSGSLGEKTASSFLDREAAGRAVDYWNKELVDDAGGGVAGKLATQLIQRVIRPFDVKRDLDNREYRRDRHSLDVEENVTRVDPYLGIVSELIPRSVNDDVDGATGSTYEGNTVDKILAGKTLLGDRFTREELLSDISGCLAENEIGRYTEGTKKVLGYLENNLSLYSKKKTEGGEVPFFTRPELQLVVDLQKTSEDGMLEYTSRRVGGSAAMRDMMVLYRKAVAFAVTGGENVYPPTDQYDAVFIDRRGKLTQETKRYEELYSKGYQDRKEMQRRARMAAVEALSPGLQEIIDTRGQIPASAGLPLHPDRIVVRSSEGKPVTLRAAVGLTVANLNSRQKGMLSRREQAEVSVALEHGQKLMELLEMCGQLSAGVSESQAVAMLPAGADYGAAAELRHSDEQAMMVAAANMSDVFENVEVIMDEGLAVRSEELGVSGDELDRLTGYLDAKYKINIEEEGEVRTVQFLGSKVGDALRDKKVSHANRRPLASEVLVAMVGYPPSQEALTSISGLSDERRQALADWRVEVEDRISRGELVNVLADTRCDLGEVKKMIKHRQRAAHPDLHRDTYRTKEATQVTDLLNSLSSYVGELERSKKQGKNKKMV